MLNAADQEKGPKAPRGDVIVGGRGGEGCYKQERFKLEEKLRKKNVCDIYGSQDKKKSQRTHCNDKTSYWK